MIKYKSTGFVMALSVAIISASGWQELYQQEYRQQSGPTHVEPYVPVKVVMGPQLSNWLKDLEPYFQNGFLSGSKRQSMNHFNQAKAGSMPNIENVAKSLPLPMDQFSSPVLAGLQQFRLADTQANATDVRPPIVSNAIRAADKRFHEVKKLSAALPLRPQLATLTTSTTTTTVPHQNEIRHSNQPHTSSDVMDGVKRVEDLLLTGIRKHTKSSPIWRVVPFRTTTTTTTSATTTITTTAVIHSINDLKYFKNDVPHSTLATPKAETIRATNLRVADEGLYHNAQSDHNGEGIADVIIRRLQQFVYGNEGNSKMTDDELQGRLVECIRRTAKQMEDTAAEADQDKLRFEECWRRHRSVLKGKDGRQHTPRPNTTTSTTTPSVTTTATEKKDHHHHPSSHPIALRSSWTSHDTLHSNGGQSEHTSVNGFTLLDVVNLLDTTTLGNFIGIKDGIMSNNASVLLEPYGNLMKAVIVNTN